MARLAVWHEGGIRVGAYYLPTGDDPQRPTGRIWREGAWHMGNERSAAPTVAPLGATRRRSQSVIRDSLIVFVYRQLA